MAIQKINLGSAPSGAGGDTQRAANTKINENFSNATHAASRLVGNNVGNIVQMETFGIAGKGWGSSDVEKIVVPPTNRLVPFLKSKGNGIYRVDGEEELQSEERTSLDLIQLYAPLLWCATGDAFFGITCDWSGSKINFVHGGKNQVNNPIKTVLYTDKNTISDSGYLKPSSPVLRLKHNSFKKEHEAEQLEINVDNPEKGVYKITGTTGLRKDDGWYFSPPKDEHFNILCMVELEEEGDTITVNTYAKKFDFEKVAIVPDYENPVDIIGEVLLRFNDLPQEQIDEPIE